MNKPSCVCGALILVLLSMVFRTGAQGLYPVSLDEKINHSSLIFEGKVINQKGFWNEQHTMIFTRNRIAVYKIFKGSPQTDSIDVITTGGSVENHFMTASHLLTLNSNDIGIFFCREANPIAKVFAKGYEIYSSSQGFLKYDMKLQSAYAPFVKYQNISKQLYKELGTRMGGNFKITNTTFHVKGENGFEQSDILNQVLAPAITSFAPATVTAGTLLDPTNNVLTINGSGFGNTPSGSAAVYFDNADDGPGGNYSGVAYNSPLIVSWSDAQIKVKVPSGAGTGLIFVANNTGTVGGSASNLTVTFNIQDAAFTIGASTIVKEIRLANTNGVGGYTVLYSNNTNNNGIDINSSAGKGTFQRALATWKECSGFNVVEGGSDTQQRVDPFDSTNMVMYDNNFPGNVHLPAGVLAVCYISGSLCTDDIVNNQAYKPGFDIVIRNNGVSTGPTVSFSYGPCSPYSTSNSDVDLETVIFHELGHAISMGHINDGGQGSGPATTNPQKVMNYAIYPGIRRISEDYSARLGAAYLINPKGVPLGSCSYSEMVPLATTSEPNDNCPASFPTSTTPPNTTVAFDLVHATSNKFVDPGYAQVTTDGTTTGVTNTAFYAFKTNSTGGNLSLSISGYTTVPVSAASCTIGPTGVPVTGVQLAVYQVASCPAGQSFPTPILYTGFQSDGIIPVNGLAANSTYLLFFDGVENTKALFNVTFSGAALPLRITEFSGKALDDENMIWWKTEIPDNITGLHLERSADGISFNTISSQIQLQDTYHDKYPFAGDNYYRLAVINKDGSVQYSKVILLAGKQPLTISAFPNPAHGSLNLNISQHYPGNYSVVLYNTSGQSVWRKNISAQEKNYTETINVNAFTAGVYHLALFNEKGMLVKSVTVMLK